jgi:hypothetical protein
MVNIFMVRGLFFLSFFVKGFNIQVGEICGI